MYAIVLPSRFDGSICYFLSYAIKASHFLLFARSHLRRNLVQQRGYVTNEPTLFAHKDRHNYRIQFKKHGWHQITKSSTILKKALGNDRI